MHIAVVGLSTIAADLVETVVRRRAAPDELLVTRVPDLASLLRRPFGTNATCALMDMAASANPPDELVLVLCRRPDLAVVAVSTTDGHAFLYELKAWPTVLGELTPQLLLDIARRGSRSARTCSEDRHGGSDDRPVRRYRRRRPRS